MNYRELEELTQEIRRNRPAAEEPTIEQPDLVAQRRQQARLFLSSMFLTLILLGGLFGFVLVENSFRLVGMGSFPQEVFSVRLTPEGIISGTDLPRLPEEELAQLARYADLAEPLLLPRSVRVIARLLLAAFGAAGEYLF